MVEFSTSLKANGLPTTVTSEKDVDVLMAAFQDYVKTLNFWQYYVLDIKAERESVKKALAAKQSHPWEGVANRTIVELAELLKSSGNVIGFGTPEKRFATHVEGPVAAGLVKAAFPDLQDVDALADAWIKIVDVVNVPLYAEWEKDTKAAMDGIKNRIKYARLDAHGPKLGPITKESVPVTLISHFVDGEPLQPAAYGDVLHARQG